MESCKCCSSGNLCQDGMLFKCIWFVCVCVCVCMCMFMYVCVCGVCMCMCVYVCVYLVYVCDSQQAPVISGFQAGTHWLFASVLGIQTQALMFA